MINKFIVAFQGLVSSFQDKSVQIQYILAILACIAAWILGCNYYEWLAILLCIGFVIVAEILNTCGGVLFASMIALSVGILIFIHHLF